MEENNEVLYESKGPSRIQIVNSDLAHLEVNLTKNLEKFEVNLSTNKQSRNKFIKQTTTAREITNSPVINSNKVSPSFKKYDDYLKNTPYEKFTTKLNFKNKHHRRNLSK